MKKVLVVDDDPNVCRLFEVTLRKAGYDVRCALSAKNALKMAIDDHPDVILSDYMMPDQDGKEFCKVVRNHKELSATPFIVITGKGTPNLKTQGLSELFDDYLEKPVNLSFLVAKVNATVRRDDDAKQKHQHRVNRLWSMVVVLMVSIIVAGGVALGFRLRIESQAAEIKKLLALKERYDKRILSIENQLDSLGYGLDDLDFERLNGELNQLIRKAKLLSRELPSADDRDVVIRGIKQVMAEFGEEDYVVPPLFAKEVSKMIDFYVREKRYHTISNLRRAKEYLPMIKEKFAEKGLPEGLAYIAMVESGFKPDALNKSSGACGLWQLMPATAREYGLRVTGSVDERTDPEKSTEVAREYIMDLIGVFGKESFMLALASYNVGDGRVRYHLKQLYNPFEERDFWYLFRKRALPEETREYVPKVIASIIIHRNQEKFGLKEG